MKIEPLYLVSDDYAHLCALVEGDLISLDRNRGEKRMMNLNLVDEDPREIKTFKKCRRGYRHVGGIIMELESQVPGLGDLFYEWLKQQPLNIKGVHLKSDHPIWVVAGSNPTVEVLNTSRGLIEVLVTPGLVNKFLRSLKP